MTILPMIIIPMIIPTLQTEQTEARALVFQAAKAEPGQELKNLWDPKPCSGSGQCPVTHSAWNSIQSDPLGDLLCACAVYTR